MATQVSHPLPAADHSGTHAAIIVLAVLTLLALALGAAILMNSVVPAEVAHATIGNPDTRIEQFPNQAAQAISPTVNTPAQNVQPTAIDRTPGPARPQPNPYPR